MNGERGYTIIEALAAISILAVSLVGLYGVGADVLAATDHIAANDRALLFAQSKLETLSLASAILPASDHGRDGGLSWTIMCRDTFRREAWNRLVLQDVELTVGWRDGGRERSIVIATRHLGRTEP